MTVAVSSPLSVALAFAIACGARVDEGGTGRPEDAGVLRPDATGAKSCNGTSDPRVCIAADYRPYSATLGCYGPQPVHIAELCTVCTMAYASASLSPVCGVDPAGRLFVFSMLPNLRMEAPGWRFGHRSDRHVYVDLEPDLLTADETEACKKAAAGWLGGGESPICPSLDAGTD